MIAVTNAESTIRTVLQIKFPEGPLAHDHYGALLLEFWNSGLASPHLLSELRTGEDGKFWSYAWEAMLYRHLQSRGFAFDRRNITKNAQAGPDFGIVRDGQTIWIEAVAPAPEGIPAEYLEPPQPLGGEPRMNTVPHEAIQLRLLSAVADKQKRIASYIEAGTIARNECAVIAVNACRLTGTFLWDEGISQLPWIVETVFPIGPLAVPISSDRRLPDGDPVRLPRYFIPKKSGAQVPTTTFLNPECAHISAVIGCVRREMINPGFSLSLVHNPHAVNKLPRGIIGASKEFVADEHGTDQFMVRPLEAADG